MARDGTGVRRRSPPVTPQSQEDPSVMTFQTMRSRNPDGSSTVYHVHESVPTGGGVVVVGPPPAAPQASGTTTHHQPYVGTGAAFGNGTLHGAPPPSVSYTPYHRGVPAEYHTQYGGPMNSVLVVRGTPDEVHPMMREEESDDDEEALAARGEEDEDNGPRPVPKCSRNTPWCIGLGIVLALSFIVGYVFLITSVVGSRGHAAPAEGRARTAQVGNGLRSGYHETSQPQYYRQGAWGGGVQAQRWDGGTGQEQLYVLTPVDTPRSGSVRPLPRSSGAAAEVAGAQKAGDLPAAPPGTKHREVKGVVAHDPNELIRP